MTEKQKLIHDVFNRQSDVLMAFKARCAENDIDFSRFKWIGSQEAPEFDPDDPETVVVLDITLGSLQETFEFAWEWVADGQEGHWRCEVLRSDPKHLRLLSDGRPNDAEGDSPGFQSWTLKWVCIQLNAGVGERPIYAISRTSPGCAMLFVAAQHPERIEVMDGERFHGFWLPGLKCTVPGDLHGRTCRASASTAAAVWWSWTPAGASAPTRILPCPSSGSERSSAPGRSSLGPFGPSYLGLKRETLRRIWNHAFMARIRMRLFLVSR